MLRVKRPTGRSGTMVGMHTCCPDCTPSRSMHQYCCNVTFYTSIDTLFSNANQNMIRGLA